MAAHRHLLLLEFTMETALDHWHFACENPAIFLI